MLKSMSCLGFRIRTEVVAALAGVSAVGLGGQPASAQFDANDVIRLNRSNPIITRNMFPIDRQSSDGANIDGPSMIRIPSFVSNDQRANSNARYYLYFGHHDGDYIRMAWSASPAGPFTLFRADANVGERGVMDNNNTHIQLDEGIEIRRNHIASPDVHVDEANDRFILYFHSGSPYRFNGRDINSQRTWVNTSDDGLFFRRRDTRPVQLGPSYFKVFENRNTLYAVHNDGGPNRARSFTNPWDPTPNYYDGDSLPSLWEGRNAGNLLRNAVPEDDRRVRHSGVRTVGNNLQLFYSIRGDSPERIFVSNISLTADWNDWTVTIPGNELLRAVGGWEGGERTPSPSVGGAATNVNQLRDPDVFQDDDGSLYLYYSGQGEEALGVAALESARQRITVAGATHDAETRRGSDSDRNFRSNTIMTVANGAGDSTSRRRGYFGFPAPGGGTVHAAVLRLYLPNNEVGSLDIYGTTSFNEATITANNQPSNTTPRLNRVPLGTPGFYELDVTDYVNSNRNGNINFFVRNTSTTSAVQILTSENGNASRRPQLKWMQRGR